MLQIASHSQSSPVFVGEVVEGEVVDYVPCLSGCGEIHYDSDYCCDCGHYHGDGDSACVSACSDYRCCQP